ncbi:MAG: CinA family nicotinamide mononucleotide deamidase-related protein [Planctomycetes bacterium]|nr:CinA family nicotinamide mononucleotide deamidase-related protein [Planctomycetota bacterium]
MERTAAILSVGEEILAGDIADANAREVAEALRQRGLALRLLCCAGDRAEDIAAALDLAARSAALVVVTGGLGPTRDDVTRAGLARAAGEDLVEDGVALAAILGFFERLGRPMAESNRLQALRPRSARAIPNALGTAPGLEMVLHGAAVFALPGVPAEMRLMLGQAVLPWVEERCAAPSRAARVRVQAHGLPESEAGERVADLMGRDADPLVGITVSAGIITVSVTSRRGDARAGRADVERVATEIERRLGASAFARDGETLEEAVVRLLLGRGLKLALAESCTGGLVARLIARVPGASGTLLEGTVAYANEAKARRLGVEAELIERCGAVSADVALSMARGAAVQAGAQVAVSTTGIAGPGGGSPEKPVGLVHFGLWLNGREWTRRVLFTGDREMIQLRAAHFALDMARRGVLQALR